MLIMLRSFEKTKSDNKKESTQPIIIRQFVEDVLDFTSQYGSAGSISYTAHNIIGSPRIYPSYGDFPEAFIIRTYGRWWEQAPSGIKEICPQNFEGIHSQDYIDLKFEENVYPIGVEIYETLNPGAVVRIWASDGCGRWVVLWQGPPTEAKLEARIFSPTVKFPQFDTNILRVEFDHRHLKSHTELDAVVLIGSVRDRIVELFPLEITKRVVDLNLHCLPSSITNEPSAESPHLKTDVDPFDKLPDELILQILSWLDLRSLCRCASVNQRLKLAAYDPCFYTGLNLRAYWWLVKGPCLTSLTSRCSRLQALDLSWCGTHVPNFVQHFVRFLEDCGKNLKILRLNNCKFLNAECLIAVAKYCLNLEELSARCVDVASGWEVLSSLQHLNRLDMYHCCVESRELLGLLPHLKQLRHLGLGAVMLGLGDLDSVTAMLASSCPQLCSLDLWKARGLSTPSESLRSVILGCPKLRKLFISAMRGVADRELLLLAERCPHLEQLDLLGARGITADACL
ncbi:hypothetical protein B566_EDAN004312, partial [Ephemera danica]